MRRRFPPAGNGRGFTLIEVLVALAILLAGVVAIVQLFPVSLRAHTDAALKGTAALLAHEKVEEIRRDRDRQSRIIQEIENRHAPTDPIVWPLDERLTYSYSGESLFSSNDTPGDPRDDVNVARVIVRLAQDFDPDQRVVYELRFDR
ncbi:prepilin-type N-terminal cleavage/methylation domain-containing protein [bacterium]|nr:prepilin-type N-terminal cleavage/methylation domain-containing protein [bacterium]